LGFARTPPQVEKQDSQQNHSPKNGGPDPYRRAKEPCDHYGQDYSGVGPEEEKDSTANAVSLIATGSGLAGAFAFRRVLGVLLPVEVPQDASN
jgi:hypothetical protein